MLRLGDLVRHTTPAVPRVGQVVGIHRSGHGFAYTVRWDSPDVDANGDIIPEPLSVRYRADDLVTVVG